MQFSIKNKNNNEIIIFCDSSDEKLANKLEILSKSRIILMFDSKNLLFFICYSLLYNKTALFFFLRD